MNEYFFTYQLLFRQLGGNNQMNLCVANPMFSVQDRICLHQETCKMARTSNTVNVQNFELFIPYFFWPKFYFLCSSFLKYLLVE